MLRPRLRPRPATLPSRRHANPRPALLSPPLHPPSPTPPQRPVPRQPASPFIARRAWPPERCTFAPQKPTWRTPCCASSASRLQLIVVRQTSPMRRARLWMAKRLDQRSTASTLPRSPSPDHPSLIARGCVLPIGCRTKPTGPATVNHNRGQPGQRCATAPRPTLLPAVPVSPPSRPPLLPTATPHGTRRYSSVDAAQPSDAVPPSPGPATSDVTPTFSGST